MTETVMGCRLRLVGNRGLYKEGPCIYLANHRAWADFFIDMYLTEGRAFILSRYLVVYVFPLFAIPAMYIGAVFAFKRNKPGQHDALNKQLDDHLHDHPDFSGFVVYPEGTRNIKPDALPLKRGLIKYTWSRGLDVQVVIAADKEHVLSQKRFSASWGVEISRRVLRGDLRQGVRRRLRGVLRGDQAGLGPGVGACVRCENTRRTHQAARAEGAARGASRGGDGAPRRMHRPQLRIRRRRAGVVRGARRGGAPRGCRRGCGARE